MRFLVNAVKDKNVWGALGVNNAVIVAVVMWMTSQGWIASPEMVQTQVHALEVKLDGRYMTRRESDLMFKNIDTQLGSINRSLERLENKLDRRIR